MSVWRHLTHPDGMTVSLLVAATGLGVNLVSAWILGAAQHSHHGHGHGHGHDHGCGADADGEHW